MKRTTSLIVNPWQRLPAAPFHYEVELHDAIVALRLVVRVIGVCEDASEKLEMLEMVAPAADKLLHQLEWFQAVTARPLEDEIVLEMREMTGRLRGD